MKIFLLMSVVCIICGVVLIANAELIFGDKLTTKNYTEAKILIFILILSMALTFPTSVFTCNIDANEKFLFGKTVILLQNLLNPFICLPLLLMGFGNIGVVGTSFVLALIKILVCGYYCIFKLKMRFNLKGFNHKAFREMSRFTFFIFINQIIDQINWNLDKFLLGRLASLSEIALYGIGGQLNSLYITCSSNVSNVFAPAINKIVFTDNDDNKLTDIFIRVGRVQYIIVMLVLLGFGIFGKQFIKLWAGDSYDESYYVALALMIPMLVPLIQNIGIEIQRAKNKHQVRSIVYLIMSILNIFVSVPLIQKFGAIGAALGTTFSLFLGNILFMNFYYHLKLGIDILRFWKFILQMIFPTIVAFILGLFVNHLIIGVGWLNLIFKIVSFTLLYLIVFWKFGFDEYEKNMVKRILSRFVHIGK